ncbi:MAG: hypothetical protein ACI4N3_05205 [Alphaproteobacteria bacterium]
MKKYKSDFGRSMVEVLLYLSIIIVMIIGSTKMYNDYNQKIKRTSAEDQLENISTKVSQIYYGRTFGNEGTSLNDKLVENGVSLVDPWGKKIDVITDNATMYHISMNLNKQNCIYLVMNADTKVKEPVINNIKDGANGPLTDCKDTNTVFFYYNIR